MYLVTAQNIFRPPPPPPLRSTLPRPLTSSAGCDVHRSSRIPARFDLPSHVYIICRLKTTPWGATGPRRRRHVEQIKPNLQPGAWLSLPQWNPTSLQPT